MLNLTIALLVQRTALATSPLLSLSSSLYTSRFINFNQVTYQRFISPIFFANSQSFNLLLQQSTFSDSVQKVAQIDSIKGKKFSSQQDFKDLFKLDIIECNFHNIKSSGTPGGAFHAITQLHTLSITRSSFMNCHSNANEVVGTLPYKVSAGAFVFTGAKASVLYSCFTQCTAVGNVKTFHIVSPEHGTISVRSLFLGMNNNNDYKGHGLFSINKGRCDIISINSSMNNIPDGYAGGSIGAYATSARAGYSVFANNTGSSVFGINFLGTISKSLVRSSAFLSNKITKYGVYMRLTGPSRLEDVTFATNQGNYFYGNAPIVFSRCICDCEKPTGLVDDEATQWNVPVRQPRHFFRVPGSCNLSEFKNIKRKHQDLRLPSRNHGIMSRNASSKYNNRTAYGQFNSNYRRNSPFSRYNTNPNAYRNSRMNASRYKNPFNPNYNRNGFRNSYNNRNSNTNSNYNRNSENSNFNTNTNSRSSSNSQYDTDSTTRSGSRGNSNTQYDSDTSVRSGSRTNSNSRYDSDSTTHSRSSANSNTQYDSDTTHRSGSRANSQYDSDSTTHSRSRANSNTQNDSDTTHRSGSRTNSNSQYDSDSTTHSRSRANSNTQNDSDTTHRSGSRTNSNSQYDSDSTTHSRSRANSNTQYDSDTNARSGSRTNSNSHYDSDSNTHSRSRRNSQYDTDSTTRSGSRSKYNSHFDSDSAPRSASRANSNFDTNTNSKFGTNTHKSTDSDSLSRSTGGLRKSLNPDSNGNSHQNNAQAN